VAAVFYVDDAWTMPDADREPEPSAALARQFKDMRGKLLAWIRRRIPDPAEAEDVLQESFLRITQRDGSDGVDHFESYLFSTARSVLADRHRRRGVRQASAHVALEPEHHHATDVDALRALLAKEKLRKASEALMSLPDRTRMVFVLRRLEGLRYGEIATRLKISVSAVEKHMARAVEHLLLNVEDRA
jgi:RNA polymerase sigma factor (sigma-70 family)